MGTMNSHLFPGRIDTRDLRELTNKVFAVCRAHHYDHKQPDSVIITYEGRTTRIDILLKIRDELTAMEQYYFGVLFDGIICEKSNIYVRGYQNVRPDATWFHVELEAC